MIIPKTYSFPTDVNGMHGIFIKIYGVDISEPKESKKVDTRDIKSGYDVVGTALQGGGRDISDANKALKSTIVGYVGSAVENLGESIVENSSAVSGQLYDVQTLYKESSKAYIFLPMPMDISVNYNASWSGERLTPLQRVIREMSEGRMDSGQAVRYAMKEGVKIGGEWGATILGGGGAASGLYGALSAAKKVFNPYTELMYNSPSLRMFTFDWTLSPKNAKEAKTIYDIVYSLKKALHPVVAKASSAEGMIWEYPDYVDITFVKRIDTSKDEKQQENEWLFSINKCAISNLNVRYDNKFHSDGSPTAVSFELQLMETQLLTQNNFLGGYDDGTAYNNYLNNQGSTSPALDKALDDYFYKPSL